MIRLDTKTLIPSVELTQDELIKAVEIQKTMQTEGWKYLELYFEVTREEIVDLLKKEAFKKDGERLCALKAATLFGYDTFRNVPAQIISKMEAYFDQKREEVENVRPEES